MANVAGNLEEVLKNYECHFTWGLEEYGRPYWGEIDEIIGRYNKMESDKFIRRFRYSLFLAYIRYQENLGGWDMLLENAFRIMENSRNPTYPQGLKKLPNCGSPLYTGSMQDFFTYVEDDTTLSHGIEDDDLDEIDECASKEELKDDADYFVGLHVAAEHVFYSLKATILFYVGSSASAVVEQLSHVVLMDDMAPVDKAALLFMKATTIRNCGDTLERLNTVVDILKSSVLTDPDNVRWAVLLVVHSERMRGRMKQYGQFVHISELQYLLQLIDSALNHDLEPWLRKKYQSRKLNILNEVITNHKNQISEQELDSLYQVSHALIETLFSCEDPKILSNCAFFCSRQGRIPLALQFIEKGLDMEPDDVHVNAKAVGIYKKVGDLSKALECAEKASSHMFVCCWQVLELKVALKHELVFEEFFSNIIEKYPEDDRVKLTHRNAGLFYVIVTGEFGQAIAHFRTLLDTCDSSEDVFGQAYCYFNNKEFHTVEAIYNVALYVLSNDNSDNESMGNIESWRGIKETIEEKFDLGDFKYTGSVRWTPKQFVDWLRQKRENGVRDYPGNAGNRFMSAENGRLQQCGNGLPRYGSQPKFGGRSHDTYMVRGSVGHYNRSSADSVPSNSYKQRFGTCHPVDYEDQNQLRNPGDSNNRGTALRYQPPHLRQNRFSECGEGTADSAENTANYFERLEISTEKTHAGAKTKTTQSRSTNVYPGDSRRNYKPEVRENWRSRADSSLQTRQNAAQSSSRMSAGVSSRNWRERDN